MTCREYTLPRDEKSTDPKGWSRGNTKIGPVLEVTTSYLQGKYGVEIRIESINNEKVRNFSWLGEVGHGIEQQQGVFDNFALKSKHVFLQADQRPKQNHKDVLLPAHPQEIYPSAKELGMILSQKIVRLSLTQCQNI